MRTDTLSIMRKQLQMAPDSGWSCGGPSCSHISGAAMAEFNTSAAQMQSTSNGKLSCKKTVLERIAPMCH